MCNETSRDPVIYCLVNRISTSAMFVAAVPLLPGESAENAALRVSAFLADNRNSFTSHLCQLLYWSTSPLVQAANTYVNDIISARCYVDVYAFLQAYAYDAYDSLYETFRLQSIKARIEAGAIVRNASRHDGRIIREPFSIPDIQSRLFVHAERIVAHKAEVLAYLTTFGATHLADRFWSERESAALARYERSQAHRDAVLARGGGIKRRKHSNQQEIPNEAN